MTDLTEFASLPLDELTAELERMLANHHAPRQSYAARTTSPLVTTPTPPSAALPLERVVASTLSEELS
jgi:hypothetical protein